MNIADTRDCAFEAFVTNLGKYNEGCLVGEWVKLPVTNEEMQEVFRRIGIGRRYEEWFITDYDCPDAAIGKVLGEYESLSELNGYRHCGHFPQEGLCRHLLRHGAGCCAALCVPLHFRRHYLCKL